MLVNMAVRKVTIRYKLNEDGKKDSTVERSVHSLVLILPIEEQNKDEKTSS